MPNLFRRKTARGTRVLKPKAKGPVTNVPGGFTRTKFRAQHQLIRQHNKFNFPDKDAALKICIQRKLGGIGDVLMTTPSVRAIRQQYPNAHIVYATDKSLFRVLENNPDIDEILDFHTVDPGSFDYFADVTSVCPPYEKKANPPINRIDLFANYIGIQLKDKVPVYVPKVDEVEWAQTWLKQKWGDRSKYKLIFLSVASVDFRRTWPIEKTTQLIDQITALRPDVRIIIDDFNKRGGPWNQRNTSSEPFQWRLAMALMNECDLFVGPDSGFLHGAGALGLNIVSIFGPTDPAARINHFPNAIAVEKGLGCQHCWYAKCNYKEACLNDLPVSQVQEAVLSKLEYKLPEGAFEDQKFVVWISDDSDKKAELLTDGIVRGLASAGYDVEKKPVKTNGSSTILIDVVNLGSMSKNIPPRSAVSCAYLIGSNVIPKWEAIRLAKNYDVLFSHSPEILEAVWAAGVRKPMHVVPLPLFQNKELQLPQDRGVFVDLDPDSDGIVASQAICNGISVVMHNDVSTHLPDSLIDRADEKSLEEVFELSSGSEEYRVALTVRGVEWGRDNLGAKAIGLMSTILYQRT